MSPVQERGAKSDERKARVGIAGARLNRVCGSSLGLRLEPTRAGLRAGRAHLACRRDRRARGALGLLVVHDADDLLAAQQGLHLLARDRLVLHERLGDGLELVAVAAEHLARLLLAIGDDAPDLL